MRDELSLDEMLRLTKKVRHWNIDSFERNRHSVIGCVSSYYIDYYIKVGAYRNIEHNIGLFADQTRVTVEERGVITVREPASSVLGSFTDSRTHGVVWECYQDCLAEAKREKEEENSKHCSAIRAML